MPTDVSQDLKSLRIERDARPTGLPGWVKGVIGLGVLVAALVLGWQTLLSKLNTPSVEVTTVALVTPTQAQAMLVATGYVVPQTKANLAPRAGGRIEKLFIEDGTEVKQGQVVAILENNDLRAQLAAAEANVKSAEARVERARVDLEDAQRAFDREKVVQEKGVSTPQAKDAAEARLNGARATLRGTQADVASAQAQAGVARVNLDNTYVRAPFAGRITQKLADVGEVVFGAVGAGAGGNGGVATLADFRTLMVEADVSESQVARLKPGTPTEIALDAFAGRTFRGKVHELRPKVDRAKATVTVKVAFVDPTTDVLPDMGAKVTFLARELDSEAAKGTPTPAVAAEAIVTSGESKVLWVVSSEGTLSSAPVVPGPPLGGLVSLRSGPPPGTRVVQRPSPELRAGMQVKEKK